MKNLNQTILVVLTALLAILSGNLLIANFKHQKAKERILYYYDCRLSTASLALQSAYQDSIDNVVLNWCGDGTK